MNAAAETPLFPSLDSIESVLWPGLAIFVFVATAVLVDVMVLLATRWHILDLPNRRSAHSLPTARAGGVPLALVSSLASLAVAVRWPGIAPRIVFGVIVPSVVIAVVGFIDDIRPLRASLRLVIQIAVAALVVGVLGPLERIGVREIGGVDLGAWGWPLSMLWVIGLINAFNFMDGSDGMAALGAMVVALFFVADGFAVNAPEIVLLAALVGAAAAGFLVFNWPPARIFMGDVGSAYLGTIFAALALLPGGQTRASAFLPLVMAMWPYILDPLLAVIRRLATGHNPLVPHREFFFHRLVRAGWSHLAVALLYALLSAVGGTAGWLMLSADVPRLARAWLPAAVAVLAVALAILTEAQFRRHGARPASPLPGEAPEGAGRS